MTASYINPVIPAKAGIQAVCMRHLDTGFRRYDGSSFLRR